tara:strand:+ start:1567 stop:1725 length:159 start_codon:yes stop_codon:yes gene_type:complete
MAIEKEDRWLWLENKIRDICSDLEIIKVHLQVETNKDLNEEEKVDKDEELTW